MTHGPFSPIIFNWQMFDHLAKHFRVIAFNNVSSGGNTKRRTINPGLGSAQEGIDVINDWYDRFFEAINNHLPPKFNLFSNCSGGLYISMWAIRHPDRVLKMFCHSPTGFNSPPENFDEYNARADDTKIAPVNRTIIDNWGYREDPKYWESLN